MSAPPPRAVSAELRDGDWYQAVRPARVLEATCDAFGVDVADVLGPSRVQSLAYARCFCAALLRELTPLSLVEIAGVLNRKDHGTTLSWLDRARNLLARESGGEPVPQFSARIDQVRRALGPLLLVRGGASVSGLHVGVRTTPTPTASGIAGAQVAPSTSGEHRR